MVGVAEYGVLLDALRGVRWTARNPARGGSSGTHRSRLRGISPEFTEYRPYRQGDDPRRLDWKLLARTDRAYLRITSDRATLPTIVMVDASASMAFPERTHEKWAQACRVAVGLFAVAHAAGDPVGLIVPAVTRMHVLGPFTRRSVLAEAIRTLGDIEPAGTPRLEPALKVLRPSHRVAIVSDFLDDDALVLRTARERVVSGADVVAVHIVAREELDPGSAAMLATDPEHHDVRRALVPETVPPYQRAFESWRAELAREWRDAGATYVMVSTAEPAAHAVRRIAEPVGSFARGA